MTVKLFGAALDALDDPERVDLKQAYIQAEAAGRLPPGLPLDPYDAIAPIVVGRCPDAVSPGGKLALPGWLTPRPPAEDAPCVDPARYRSFLDRDDINPYLDACACFVERSILPDIPCMIAVDHAMTAGPLKALAERYDPAETTVVIIDSHFDAIPSHIRTLPGHRTPLCGSRNCGSFLAPLMDEGIICPENLVVVGVSDYPIPGTADLYRQAYRRFIDQGVTVIPRAEAEAASFPEELEARLMETRGTRLYISLDADAGALTCMNAVRFMDTRGLQEKTIIRLAGLFGKLVNSGRYELAGLDTAEVDVHFLHLEGTQGTPDRTDQVCAAFIIRMVQAMGELDK